ncbi:MAG TPA: hypothetical protein VF676_04975 [Flavobacterium sp.]|jgi:hypothetical protein
MKTIQLFLYVCAAAFIASCNAEDDKTLGEALFAVPEVKSLTEIRDNITVLGAKQTQSDGKIYVAANYIFYIAKEDGVHVFDNSNPSSPQNIAFLNIDGVHDIAVKGNRLYADNYVDLVVFDLSDMQDISVVQTIQNVFDFYPEYPQEAEFYDYTVGADEGELIIGFQLETRARPDEGGILMSNDALGSFSGAAEAAGVGTGGSYARFQVRSNALYAVESYHLNVFNIGNPDNAFFHSEVYTDSWFGGEFETLFSQKEYLFVGSTTGMFVVNAEDEFHPVFISEFSHATACDPVVVDGTKAYITVRGGTTCGATEDQINVINVAEMSNPTLLSTYLLEQPYGLGIKDGVLYVCCGANGLKVFDASSSILALQNSYGDNVTDVIPLETHLVAVGLNTIRQYSYGSGFTLQPISVLAF